MCTVGTPTGKPSGLGVEPVPIVSMLFATGVKLSTPKLSLCEGPFRDE